MKIQLPKDDNYILMLDKISKEEKFFIHILSTCNNEALLNHLVPFVEWVWVKSDLIAWAPVLNRFDDLLQKYIIHNKLNKKDENTANQEASNVNVENGNINTNTTCLDNSFIPSDELVEEILRFTYCILDNCLNKSKYNSLDNLLALLWCFNPKISILSAEILNIYYLFIKKTKKNENKINEIISSLSALINIPVPNFLHPYINIDIGDINDNNYISGIILYYLHDFNDKKYMNNIYPKIENKQLLDLINYKEIDLNKITLNIDDNEINFTSIFPNQVSYNNSKDVLQNAYDQIVNKYNINEKKKFDLRHKLRIYIGLICPKYRKHIFNLRYLIICGSLSINSILYTQIIPGNNIFIQEILYILKYHKYINNKTLSIIFDLLTTAIESHIHYKVVSDILGLRLHSGLFISVLKYYLNYFLSPYVIQKNICPLYIMNESEREIYSINHINQLYINKSQSYINTNPQSQNNYLFQNNQSPQINIYEPGSEILSNNNLRDPIEPYNESPENGMSSSILSNLNSSDLSIISPSRSYINREVESFLENNNVLQNPSQLTTTHNHETFNVTDQAQSQLNTNQVENSELIISNNINDIFNPNNDQNASHISANNENEEVDETNFENYISEDVIIDNIKKCKQNGENEFIKVTKKYFKDYKKQKKKISMMLQLLTLYHTCIMEPCPILTIAQQNTLKSFPLYLQDSYTVNLPVVHLLLRIMETLLDFTPNFYFTEKNEDELYKVLLYRFQYEIFMISDSFYHMNKNEMLKYYFTPCCYEKYDQTFIETEEEADKYIQNKLINQYNNNPIINENNNQDLVNNTFQPFITPNNNMEIEISKKSEDLSQSEVKNYDSIFSIDNSSLRNIFEKYDINMETSEEIILNRFTFWMKLHIYNERIKITKIIIKALNLALKGYSPTDTLIDIFTNNYISVKIIKYILKYPYKFGLCIYGYILGFIYEHIYEDPTILSTLLKEGILNAMLNSINENNFKNETVLIYVPSLLSLMFIHSIGKSAMKKLGYSPIYNLFYFVLKKDYFFYDRFGDIAVSIGNIANELENYGFTMKDFVTFHIMLLKELYFEGINLGYWKCIDYNYLEKHVEQFLKKPNDIKLNDLNIDKYKHRKDNFFFDRLSIVCRCILSYMKGSWGELCFDLGENIVVVKQSEIKKLEANNININDANPEFHFNKSKNYDLSQTSFISGPFIDRNKMILHCITHLFNILYFLIAAYADTKGLYANEDKLYETTELSNRKVLEIFSDILITIESVYDFYFNLYFYQTNDLSNNICLQSKDKVSIHEHIKRKLRINQNKSDYLLYNLFCSTRSLFCYSVNNNAYELNNNQIKTHLIYDIDQNDYKLTDHLKSLENDDNVYKAIYKYTFSQVLLEFNSFNHKNCKTPSEIVAHKKKEKYKFKKYFPSFYNSENKIKKNNTNSDSNILHTHNSTLNDLENNPNSFTNQNSENKKLSQEDIFKIYYTCMNQSKQGNTNENEKNSVKQKSEKYNDYYINDENVNMHTSYPYQSKYVMCESLKSLLVIIKNFFVMLNVLCHSKQAKLKSNSNYIYYNIIQQKHLLCIIRCLTKCMLNVPLVSKPIHENSCIGSNSLYNILSDHITLEKMNYLDNNCSSECTSFFTEDIYANGSESALKNSGKNFQNNKQNFNIYDYSYTPYINFHTQKIDPFYPEYFYMEDILFKKYNLNFFGTKVVPNKDLMNTEGGNEEPSFEPNSNMNYSENCNYNNTNMNRQNNDNNFSSNQNQFEYNHNIIDQTIKSESNYKLSDYNKVHICTITSDSYNANSIPNVSFNDIDNMNNMNTQNNNNQFSRGTGIAISSINGYRKTPLYNDGSNCDINNNKRLGNNINSHNDYKNFSNENQMEKVKININSYTPIKTVKYISELINTLHKLLSDSKLEFVSYFYFLDLLYKVGTFDFIFNMFNYLMSVYISLLAIYFKKMKNEKNPNFYSNFTSYIPIHISKNYTCTNTYFVRYVIRLMQYFAKSDINTIKIYMEITIKSINTFLDFFMNIISIGKFNVIFFTSKMLHPFTKLNRTYGKPNNKHEKKINAQDNEDNADDSQIPHSYSNKDDHNSNAKIKINGSRDFVTTTDGNGEKNSFTQNKNNTRFANNKQNYKNKKEDENVRKEDESNKKDDESDKYFTYNNNFSFTLDYLDVINTIRSVKCDITNNIFMWLTYINSTSVKINNLGKNNIYINFNNNIIFGFLKIILKFIYHSIDTEPKLLEFWGKEQMKDKKFTGNKEKDKEMYNYPNIDILQELKLMGFDEKNIYDSLNCSGTTDLYSTLNYLDKTREKDNPFSLKTEKGDTSSHNTNKENKISFYYGSDENSSDENSTNHNRSRRNNRAEDAFRLNSFIDNMQSLSENNAAINRVENNNIEGFDKDAENVTETDNGKKSNKKNEQDNNMLYKEDKYVLGKYPFMYEILKEAKEKGKHARLHYFETIMDPYNKKNMIFYLQYYLKLLKKKIFLSYNENNIIKKFWNDEKYLILKQYIYKYIFNMLINIMITIPYNELSFMNLYLSFLVIDIDKKSVKLFLDQYKKTIHDKNSNKSRIFNHQDVKIIILYYFIENISKKIKMLKNDESFPFEPFYHCNHLFMYFNKKKTKNEKKSEKAKKGSANQTQNPLNNMTHSNSNESNPNTSLNNPTNNIDITNTTSNENNQNRRNRPENYQHGDYDTSNHSDDNMAESNLQNGKINNEEINNQQQTNIITNSDLNKQTNDVKSSLYGMKYIKGDMDIIYESQRDMEIYSYHFCLYMLYFTLFNIINKYSLAKNIILHIDRNIIDYCIFFIQKFNISYLKSVENSVNHFLSEQNELPSMLQKKAASNSQMLINKDTLNVSNTEICTNCDNNLAKNNKKKRKYNKIHTCGQPDENTNCTGCAKQINNSINSAVSNMNDNEQENISHDPTHMCNVANHTNEYINNSQIISAMKNEENSNESNILNYDEQINQTNEMNNCGDKKINIMYNKGLVVNQSIKTNNMLIPYWNFLDVDYSEYNQKTAINNSSLENEENKFISLYSKPPCFYTPLFMCLYKIIINYSLYNFNDKNKKLFKKKKEENLNEEKSFYSTNIGTDGTTLKTEKNSMIHKDNLPFTKTEKMNNLNDKRNSNNNIIFDMALTLSNQINANNNGINFSQKMNMENIRFISSEKQHNIIKICIDTLHFFKGYNSQLCLSILQIIEYLTTTYNNAVFLLSYRPPNVYKHFREVFEIEERKKTKLGYNTNFTNSTNTNNCFEKINKSENDIKNNTECDLTDIHKIGQLKKEKNIEGENENSSNNISELDINELILQNMCQSSLGILLTISKHAKFKDMLIILINILIQCFTDNYVIMNKIEYSLKSYFLCHGIPVKCFMKKNDLKSIKNNDFINALGVSLNELNEALYPFIFKNPQLYEEILSSLCFFPNLKYVKDPKKDKYEDIMNSSVNVSYDPSILINSDFDSGKIFQEKNSNIDYINNNEIENLLEKSCKNQYYLNCLPIPENIKSIYMLSDIANSTKSLKKYYMKNNFYNFYILATLIDFLNLFTIIQSKTRVTKLNEKEQRLKFNQKLMEIYGNDVDFDNELDYKVMYPFALTADNLLFIINLIFKTFKHLIVYLIKMPPFNQKIIKTFIQPDNSPINKGDNLYTNDNTAFNNGIEKSGNMGNNMNNSGSKDNKICSIQQNTTNLFFTKNKNVSTTSHINNLANNMIAKKNIYETKTETEITRPDSINSYKEISEYYLQNYMQLFSIFDASKLSFRSCLFPFLSDNTNISDINKQSNNDKNNPDQTQTNSYNNVAFTPFLIFLFKRILPQFICMSNPIIYSPYSFSNFEKKFTNNIDVYYAALNNNASKNMAYIKHIFNFVQLIFDIHNSNYDIHKKVVLEIVHLLKIYSNFQKKKDIINNNAFTTVMSVFSNAISSLLFKLINEDQNVKIEKNSIVVEDKQILKNTKNLSKLLDSLVKIEKNTKANNDNDDDKPYQNGRRSSIGSIKKYVIKNSGGNKKGIGENVDDNKEEEETEKVFAYSKEQLVLFRNSLCNLLNKLDYGKDDFVNTATSIIRSLSVLTSSSIMGHSIKSPNINSHMIKLNKINNAQKKKNDNKIKRNKRRKNISSSTFLNPSYIRFRSDSNNSLLNCNENQHQILDILLEEDGAYNINDDIDEYNDDYIDDCEQNNKKHNSISLGFVESARDPKNDERDIKTEYPSMSNNHPNSLNNVLNQAQHDDTSKSNIFTNLLQTDKINNSNQNIDHNTTKMKVENDNNNVNQNTLFNSINNNAIINSYTNLTSESNINSNTQLKEENDGSNNKINTGAYISEEIDENAGNVVSNCNENKINDEEDAIDVVPKTNDNSSNNNNLNNEYDINLIDLYYHFYNYNNRDINTMLSENNSIMYLNETGRIHSTCEKNTNNLITAENQQNEVVSTDNVPNPSSLNEMPVSENIIERRSMNINNNIPSRINNSPINSTNILSLMNQLCSNLLTINRRRSDPINNAIATTLHLPDGVRNNNSISNANRFDISANIINGNNGSNQNGLTYYHINYDRMNNMMSQNPFNNLSNNRQNINNTNTNNNYMNNTNNNLRNLYNNIRNYNISDNNLASIRNLNYSNMRNFRSTPSIEDEAPINDNNDMARYASNISQANEIDENARMNGDAIRAIPITEPTDAEDQIENIRPTNNIDSNKSENSMNKNKNEKNASDIDDNGKNYKDDKKEDSNNKDSKKGEKFTLIDSILDNDKKLKSDICNIMYNRLCKSVPKVNINLPFDNLVEEKNKIIDKIHKCIEEKKKKKNELPIDIKKNILNDDESAKVDDSKPAIKLEEDPNGNLIENITNSQTEAPLNTAINNANEIEDQTKKQLNAETQINQDNINESPIRNILDNLDDLDHAGDLSTPFLLDPQPNNENTPNTNEFNNSNINENDAYGEVTPEDEEEDPEDYKNINYDELFDRMLKIESIFIICCSLGINEKQFFEILNVDRAFLVELPTNLIEEIIFQHLKNITLNKIIEKEQENINNTKKISIKTYKKYLKYKEFIKSQEQSSNVLEENESNDVTATQDETGNTLPPTGETNDETNKEHDENVRIYNSIKKSYLDALPSSVRSEIKKRIIGNKGQRADSQDETNIAFIESLTSDLRRDVLSSASLRFIRTLTEEMIEESRNLRFSALNNRYPNILASNNRPGNVSQTNENSGAHVHVQSSNANAENTENAENNENGENIENNEHSENSDNDENDEGTIIPIENVSNVLSRDENGGVVIINGDQNEVDENDGDENDGDDNDGDTIVINDMRNMPIASRLSRRESLQGRLANSVFINAPSNLNSHTNNNFNGINAINSIIISSNDRSPRNNRNMFFPGNRNSLSSRRRFNIPIRNSLPNININRNNFIRITYNDNNNPIIMINTGHENYDSIAVSRFLDNFLGSRSSDISIPGMGLGANNNVRGNFMPIPNSMNINDNNDINNNANNDNNRSGNNNNEIHRITNANITNNGNNFNFNYGDSTNINQPRQLRRNDNRTNNNNTNNVDHNYHIMGDDKLLEKEDNASLSKYLKNLFPSNNNKLNADKENDTALYVCLEEPVPSQALIDICRLLFLKKEINKKIMFTLFCNLICSYQKTKLYTLQLFMNILWSASIDLHGKSDSPNYIALSNAINFPPKMLYQNVNKKTLGLFSDNYFTTSYISAERVLEQVQSLLITIPHITSFFSMELIHPALFIPKEIEHKIKKKKQKPSDGKKGSIDGCRSFLDELERKRDKLELDQFEDTEDIRLNEYNENNKFDNVSNKNNEQKEQENIPDDETAILEYELKRKRPKMETPKTVNTTFTNNINKNDIINLEKLNNDYPINILFKLLDSSLYLTSKKLISHLLSVIYNILINSAKKEYAYANFTKWIYAENLQYIISNAEELIQNDSADVNANGSEIIASNTNGKNENNDNNIKDNQNNEDNNEGNTYTSSNKDKKEKEKNTNLNEFYHNNNTASKINKELLLNIKNIKPNEFEKNDYTLKPYYLLEVISINAISNLSKLICNYKTNFLWINSNNNLEQVHKQDISLLIQIAVIFFSHYKLKRLTIQTLKYHTHILIKRIIYDLNKIVQSINNKTFNLYSIDHSDSLEQKLIALYRVITILFNAPSVIDSLTNKKQKKNIPKSNNENENSKLDNPTDPNSQNNSQTSNNETFNIANDNAEINNATSESNKKNKLENDDVTNESENNKINEESKFDICADFFLSINIDLLWEEFNKTMQVINNSLIDKNYKFKCNNETQLINNNSKTTNENIDLQNNDFNHPDKNTFFCNNLDSNITKHEQNEGVENPERNENDQNGEQDDDKKKENSDEPPPTILNYLLPLMEAYLFIEEVILVSQYKLRKFKDLEKKVANLNIESIKINEKLAYEDYPFYISIYNKKNMKQNEYHMNEFEMFKENYYEEENDQDENNEYIQIKLEDQGQISNRHKKLIQFVYINRRVINSLIKQTPILLHHNFKSLIKLTSSCINFENKRLYLRKKLKYLKSGARSEPIKLNIRREKVFTDSYYQLRNKSGNDLKGKLVVTFKNEEGVDAGGLTREWYSILAKEIFNPNYALFCREGEKCEFNHPNPLSYINPDHLHFFKFVGKFIAKAIYDGQVIDAYFCRSFYKHMLGRKILPADAESVDPEFYKSLIQISQYKLEDLNLEINFSTEIDEFGKTKIIDLIPNGRNIPVTDENKHKYIELLCELKVTNSIKEQLEAFMDGFKELIQPKLISIFDDKELELLISGIPTIDLNDLKENVEYHNYTPNSIQIIWLWEVLEEFDENKKASFLQFVTGTSRVPLGGFKNLMGMRGEQKMIIYKAYGEDRLPTAHTCFNQLDLPEYSSKECLRSKLIRAIMEGKEGFGFI
ncbi:E3 ubiquitin-protein ligase, putative [Plasmodium vinckei brucechwatti]|uniref:HECT-type E3 ubiquitin transferase n=1 Tax=Plasmodium vinckei brucechwatti TaxID=119398 RepID=A0A6V7S1J5_PLAVN|nr:E3 ubiquitin-protein ligase, putative [Plasmodium vinckei brucechwatti]